MNKLTVVCIGAVLFWTGFYFYSCRNNDLRGWWKESHDGKTYLVIDDPDGGSVNTAAFTLNGQPWPYAIGERGEIEPGCHYLDKVGFCVKPGVEYHFDYWGP